MSKTQLIIADCLDSIARKYNKDGVQYLAYHNVEHAHDVMEAAVSIGEEIRLCSHDLDLLRIAACFHDIEHSLGRGEDERASAAIAAEVLSRNGYSDDDITKVKGMILATIVSFKDGKIRQSATDDILTKILADADLASFGRPFSVFWDRSVKLHLEHGGNSILQGHEKKKFTELQMNILEKHKYYLTETEKVFPHKNSNIANLKNL